MTKAISVQCTAISKQTGKQCKAKAIPGGTVCRWHGGEAKQVEVKAAIRAEVMNWGLVTVTLTLARFCSGSSRSPPPEQSITPDYCRRPSKQLSG
jgi:hypothetical protein